VQEWGWEKGRRRPEKRMRDATYLLFYYTSVAKSGNTSVAL